MVATKKNIYLATSLNELKKKSEDIKMIQSARNNIKRLVDSLNMLHEKLTDLMEGPELDEEQIYLISFRIMLIWQMIENTDEYKDHNKYYKLMFGTKAYNTLSIMEEMEKSLEKRYPPSKKVNPQIKDNEQINDKKNKGINGISNNTLPIETVKQSNKEPVSITCKDLYDKLLGNENILVIDVRSQQDFQNSKFRKGKMINIPNTLITPGISAAKMRERLTSDDHYNWDHRDEFNLIILVDWQTKEDILDPDSTLTVLKNIFLKWDPGVKYKEKPLILEGGYERFLDSHPYFTTNPHIKRPQNKENVNFVPLDEINYPMTDLLGNTIPSENSSITLSNQTNSTFSSGSVPTFDRSTKPNLSKPISKSTLSEDVTVNESSSSETVTSSSLEVTPEELPPKSTPENQSLSDLSEIVSKSLPTSLQDHRTPPPTPNKTFFGDEDNNNFSFTKLKSDEMSSFSSGLKRSLSSPNIAQLKDDEEINQKVIPLIDRNSKPSARLSFVDSYSPKSHGNVQRGLTGLKNLGNLCYMNSIMQCVSNTEELKSELMSLHSPHKNRNSKTKGLVFDAVKQLIRLLHQGAYRWVSCQELKAVAGQFCNTFAGYEQQDSHEFLTELMDWLHEDLNYPSPNISLDGASEETGEKAWGEFKKNNESIVLNLFYGQLRSTITCSDCNKKSIKFDPFSNLSLPLPMEKDKINLSDCLRLYLRGETISGWICPRCKVPRQAVKKFDITRLPPVLVIHLKRFMTEFVGVGWTRKKGNMVEFPLDDLDMRQYVVNNEQRFHTYNLYAVSNHYGTMDSGHYTAYCKNYALKKWFKFDDQEVAEISSSGVRTSAAYILFYSAIGKS